MNYLMESNLDGSQRIFLGGYRDEQINEMHAHIKKIKEMRISNKDKKYDIYTYQEWKKWTKSL